MTTAPEVPVAERNRSRPVGDLVRSMLVIVAIVGLLVLIVPRPNKIPTRSLDVPAAAAANSGQLGFTPAVPDLPAGWTARAAELQHGTDDRPTWHLAYLTPSGRYAGVQQAKDATAEWEATQVTDGRRDGTVQVAGKTWTVRSRTDRGTTSWVLTQGGVTTVVTGTATVPELTTLATAAL